MPLLLLVLLILVGAVALWALLLPLALVQRYRYGRQRRRAHPLAVRINAWLLLVSVPPFLGSAWIATLWVPRALAYGAAGLGAGLVLGLLGAALTRIERTPRGLYYTPPAWLVLGLTLLVAARIAWSAVGLWQRWHGAVPAANHWGDHAGLFAAGGLLLGYALTSAWTLKRRLG